MTILKELLFVIYDVFFVLRGGLQLLRLKVFGLILCCASSFAADNPLKQAIKEASAYPIKVASKHSEGADYLSSILQKLKASYKTELERLKIDPIHGAIKYKLTINPSGNITSLEFLSDDVPEKYKMDMRYFIYQVAPFGEFPDELLLNTDVLEIIHTYRF